ncbi:MAG: GNAT family N-acetyltransferase [Chloroflexota bacterium]
MTVKLVTDHRNIDWQCLADVIEKAPLGTRNPHKLRVTFQNSAHTCFLFDDDQLIGAARAMADGFDCAVICDVVILPEYQGQSLGSRMIRHLLDQVSHHEKVILYAVPGKEGFYETFGFRRMTTAMAIFENPSLAYEQGVIERV